MPSVLIVLSGVDSWTLKDGSQAPTGYWAEEFVTPHRIFTEEGFDITVATPRGVEPTPDEVSLSPAMNGGSQEAADGLQSYIAGLDALKHPVVLESLNPADYDAVFVPGGHGPMQDLAQSAELGTLLTGMNDTGRIVSAVCHGPAGLAPAVNADGSWAFEGRRLTSFSNEEETQVGYTEKMNWLLETRLGELGGKFEAPEPWQSFVVVDGNLVTGANPASSAETAKAVVQAVRERSNA